MSSLEINADIVAAHLKAKFDECDGFVSVWTKQDGRTEVFATDDLERVAEYITSRASRMDVYVANSTLSQPPERGKRGSEADTFYLTGAFFDVDFASEKASKVPYPVDSAEVDKILAALNFPPTIRLNSGRGEQWHYLVQPSTLVQIEEARARAKALLTRFHRVVAAHFGKFERKIDAVHDLVRNGRVPGTLNHSCTPPRPVQVISSDRRYTLEQIESFVAEHEKELEQQDPQQDRRNWPLADHEQIVAGCEWYRTVAVEGAASCTEPDWFASASITAACKDGEVIFLGYSAAHPDFSEREAVTKFRRAVAADAPRTCESIARDLGHADTCTECPHFGKIKSPVQLGRSLYEPGDRGPVPLGYTAEGNFVFLDQVKKILFVLGSTQLLSVQILVGLAPANFWAEQFPSKKKDGLLDAWGAGQALIECCQRKGPFDPRRVRGRGAWLEGSRIVANFGKPTPPDVKNFYLCFEPLPVSNVEAFDTVRLHDLLRRFMWRNPDDATLLLGWLAIAPICGVLTWRPHCFVYGPPNCGKSTLHTIASNLLTPLAVSADGQSSEAGIRQMIKADSRPVIIDEFESDQARSHIGAVIRLARSSSSAESPVLRGTPEGKAMHFALRTCFFFAAVNPSGMSPADATRILLFEMLAHGNDPDVAARIAEDEAFFVDKGPEWCGYMVGLAHLIPAAIAAFSKALPGIDSRHRKNVATLLAGAFVALHGAAPTETQARDEALRYKTTVELHAEAFERDDAAECLHHLLAFQIERQTLGYWLAAAQEDQVGGVPEDLRENTERILRNYDLVVRTGGDQPGFFIRNGSPAVENVFRDTKWARSAWEKALRKLNGYFALKSPIHFSGLRGNSRAIGLPLEFLPEIEFDEVDPDKPRY